MTWKYRIREVSLTTGETRYFPQYCHKGSPFWCHFRDYPSGNKVSFSYYDGAIAFVNGSKANDEPEVKRVVHNHYL
ncbi:hypothethical phage protein [Citrobacter phage CR8]|uniref:Hypothethical phage protein n=1 Tax=Citrobacter phage CR8 TaxID=1455076 RepID=W6PUQ3_9CAUD|nr:hypothethical phage protein [Citrobacter phage CR8]CDM21613.1 hypothethical phage protein [Citrobacter phage CR8]